jgi:predicted sugar kinase
MSKLTDMALSITPKILSIGFSEEGFFVSVFSEGGFIVSIGVVVGCEDRRRATLRRRRTLPRAEVIKFFPQEEKHDPKAQKHEEQENQLLLLVGEPFPVARHLVLNQVSG